jgi:signal peptidase I
MNPKLNLKIFIFLMIFFHGIYILKQSYGIGFSVTPSLPYYAFLIDKKDLTFSKKDLIVFKYPGENVYNYKTDESFVKIVSCVPGEILKTKNYEYFCNDEYIGKALLKDGQGKSLNPFVFNGIIPKNNYFVTGTHQKSWDSKYWGFVSKDRIIATAKGLI